MWLNLEVGSVQECASVGNTAEDGDGLAQTFDSHLASLETDGSKDQEFGRPHDESGLSTPRHWDPGGSRL